MEKSARETEERMRTVEADVEKLGNEIRSIEVRMIKWMLGINISMLGIITAIGIAVYSGLFYELGKVRDGISDAKVKSLQQLVTHISNLHASDEPTKYGKSQIGNQ